MKGLKLFGIVIIMFVFVMQTCSAATLTCMITDKPDNDAARFLGVVAGINDYQTAGEPDKASIADNTKHTYNSIRCILSNDVNEKFKVNHVNANNCDLGKVNLSYENLRQSYLINFDKVPYTKNNVLFILTYNATTETLTCITSSQARQRQAQSNH